MQKYDCTGDLPCAPKLLFCSTPLSSRLKSKKRGPGSPMSAPRLPGPASGSGLTVLLLGGIVEICVQVPPAFASEAVATLTFKCLLSMTVPPAVMNVTPVMGRLSVTPTREPEPDHTYCTLLIVDWPLIE